MRAGRYIKVQIWTVSYWGTGYVALIQDSGHEFKTVIPVFLGEYESRMLILCINRIQTDVPVIHDLFFSLTDAYGARLESAELYDDRDGRCFCRLTVNRNKRIREFSVAPADGLTLMLKSGCDLLVKPDFFLRRGIPRGEALCLAEERLRRELSEAVQSENYELAAQLRDQLSRIA